MNCHGQPWTTIIKPVVRFNQARSETASLWSTIVVHGWPWCDCTMPFCHVSPGQVLIMVYHVFMVFVVDHGPWSSIKYHHLPWSNDNGHQTDHGRPWSVIFGPWSNWLLDHGLPRKTKVNQDGIHGSSWVTDYGQPWTTIVGHELLCSTMKCHEWPWTTMVVHEQPPCFGKWYHGVINVFVIVIVIVIMVWDCEWSWSETVSDHGQPWFMAMVDHGWGQHVVNNHGARY